MGVLNSSHTSDPEMRKMGDTAVAGERDGEIVLLPIMHLVSWWHEDAAGARLGFPK